MPEKLGGEMLRNFPAGPTRKARSPANSPTPASSRPQRSTCCASFQDRLGSLRRSSRSHWKTRCDSVTPNSETCFCIVTESSIRCLSSTRRRRLRNISGKTNGRASFPRAVSVSIASCGQERSFTSSTNGSSPDPGPACRYGGGRSLVAVPMLKEDELVGAFAIYRQDVRAFTDREIELVQGFAAQAAIAIENARLLKELRQRTGDLTEALEQQTATSEVLKVISSSPGELQPVFESMLANAVRICGAKFGVTSLREGDGFRVIATHQAPAALVEARRRDPLIRPTPGHNLDRLLRTEGRRPRSGPLKRSGGGAHPCQIWRREGASQRAAVEGRRADRVHRDIPAGGGTV